jgi:hypothetical protein
MADGMLTEDMLAEWHGKLNSKCFENVLPLPTFYIGLCRDPVLGADDDYEALYYADYVGRGTIFINPRYCTNPEEALAALAHEMIHQWQDLCGLRLDHRAVFHAWGQHIYQLTGITV